MSIYTQRPALRWGAPVLAVAVLAGGGAAYGARTAFASTSLPHRTAQQLLVDVQQAHVDGMSGTVVESANLGLPSLSATTSSSGSQGSSSLSSMLSGTHTLRVWDAGSSQSRVALLGSLGESDVIRNGSDLWVWSSKDRTATHVKLPAGKAGAAATKKQLSAQAADGASPSAAAKKFLALVGPTTAVSVDGTASVAGRAAYELVLKPKTKSSLVASVRIAIDGKTHLPLRVQVYSTKLSKPAFEVAYSAVSFAAPDASTFRFDPPAGTKVSNQTLPMTSGTSSQRHAKMSQLMSSLQPGVVGKSWSSVLTVRIPVAATPDHVGIHGRPDASAYDQIQHLLRLLPTVHGSWGSGKLLSGTVFSALMTSDGRILVGAVTPQALYAAAAK